jgi:hypothetical protein
MRSITVVLAFLLGVVGVAGADQRFHSVPRSGKGPSPLQLKVIAYDGGTNGELTVEIKNTAGRPMRFAAEGLYFVPDGDPDTAPQRLGAVGPLRLATDDDVDEARQGAIQIAAGASVKVTLDVFCIDSHRASPSSNNTFTLGTKRLPKALAQTIETRAKRAAKDAGGYAAPAATSAIQSEVWKARDARWIELDGEGAQDAAK